MFRSYSHSPATLVLVIYIDTNTLQNPRIYSAQINSEIKHFLS